MQTSNRWFVFCGNKGEGDASKDVASAAWAYLQSLHEVPARAVIPKHLICIGVAHSLKGSGFYLELEHPVC